MASQLLNLVGVNVDTVNSDVRFSTTNQTQHCWTRFNEFVLCARAAKENGQDADTECASFRRQASFACPNEWMENWDEAREEGKFLGVQG